MPCAPWCKAVTIVVPAQHIHGHRRLARQGLRRKGLGQRKQLDGNHDHTPSQRPQTQTVPCVPADRKDPISCRPLEQSRPAVQAPPVACRIPICPRSRCLSGPAECDPSPRLVFRFGPPTGRPCDPQELGQPWSTTVQTGVKRDAAADPVIFRRCRRLYWLLGGVLLTGDHEPDVFPWGRPTASLPASLNLDLTLKSAREYCVEADHELPAG